MMHILVSKNSKQTEDTNIYQLLMLFEASAEGNIPTKGEQHACYMWQNS